jgi:hypothetical protein
MDYAGSRLDLNPNQASSRLPGHPGGGGGTPPSQGYTRSLSSSLSPLQKPPSGAGDYTVDVYSEALSERRAHEQRNRENSSQWAEVPFFSRGLTRF